MLQKYEGLQPEPHKCLFLPSYAVVHQELGHVQGMFTKSVYCSCFVGWLVSFQSLQYSLALHKLK